MAAALAGNGNINISLFHIVISLFKQNEPGWHGSCSIPVMSGNPLITQTLIRFDNSRLRRTTMMSIKDLSSSKELDSKAMADVRGGLDFNVLNLQALGQQVVGGGGIGSPTIGIQVAPLISVNTGVEQHLSPLFAGPQFAG
jgi:hypothetical protein